MYAVLSRSILAGVAISIGGVVNLRVGSIAGAVLFTFGLLTVVHYQWDLYTGKAGFWPIPFLKNLKYLLLVLLGNVIGCAIVGSLIRYSIPEIIGRANLIVETRLTTSAEVLLILGAGCGFLMTTAVTFAKENKFLPLLFAVPTFILCGFAHSIADAFYFFTALPISDLESKHVIAWLMVVLGNFIGCNLYLLSHVSVKNQGTH